MSISVWLQGMKYEHVCVPGTVGLVEMTSLASFREWEARISLSAAITLVLASLEASASMAMAR